MAHCAQYMGVNVSPSESQLLAFAYGVQGIIWPAYQAEFVAEKLRQARLLEDDVRRVADWKAAHPNG